MKDKILEIIERNISAYENGVKVAQISGDDTDVYANKECLALLKQLREDIVAIGTPTETKMTFEEWQAARADLLRQPYYRQH